MIDKFMWDEDDIEVLPSVRVKNLIKVLKAWPTREERLRKGLATKPAIDSDVKIIKPADETALQRLRREQKAKKLQRAAKRKERRRKLQEIQQERRNASEAEL